MEKTDSFSRSFACENLSFAAKEAYKKLRVNLMIALADEDRCHIIGITSAQPSEGKSLTALNTAYSIAETGKRVLLIDSDMRRPSIHLKTGFPSSPGLADLLSDTTDVGKVVNKYENDSFTVKMDIITGGEMPKNPSELLNSHRMTRLMEALRDVYDYIIMDLPPIGAVIDAVSVAKNMDGMLVVIRENSCPKNIFAECIEQLQYAKIRILGFVVNGSQENSGKYSNYNKYKYGVYSSGSEKRNAKISDESFTI